MYIFIDDSGDPGIKFDQGSTSFFVIAAIIFFNTEAASAAHRAIDQSRVIGHNQVTGEIIKYTQEYKYSKLRSKPRRKNHFFEAIKSLDFTIYAVAANKRKLHNPTLIENPKQFQNEMLTQLLVNIDEITHAHLVLDGADLKTFGISNETDFLAKVNSGSEKITKVSCADSKNHNLIQLADMAAGTIRNYYESRSESSIRDYISIAAKLKNTQKFR